MQELDPDPGTPLPVARRILLVEDDDLLRGSLSLLLEEEGYAVTAVESALRALEVSRTSVFDLVITDVRMPGMSGISMLRQMRQSAPETRAVVITGFADFETPVEAFRLQVDDFLTKPFDEATFLKSVQRAMEWLDRQAWWRGTLERSYRDSLSLWEWALVGEREGPRRRRQLARRLGARCGLAGEELEALEWAALLAALSLRQGGQRCRELLAEDPSARKGWERRSVLRLAERAFELVESSEGLSAAILAAVARFDALAHPADAALGLSRAECLQALRREWEGPPEVLTRLEEALAGGPEELPEPSTGAPLALAASAMAAGHPELARDALAPLEALTAPARLCLGTAQLALGQAQEAAAQAELALSQAGGTLEKADALALMGAARLAAGQDEGEEDLTRAGRLFEDHGAARGAVRTLLLRAWGLRLAGAPGAEPAVRALLERVEGEGLEWVLGRERWLALEVLGQDPAWRARLLPGQQAAPAALVVEGLGPLRLSHQGREIREQDWKTSKSRGLFLVLLLHGGIEVPDERLTDLFWSELEGDRAQANLYSALTYIRKAVGEGEVVEHRRGRCRFNADLSHQVDFLEFERMVSTGLARWRVARTEGAGLLRGALELYRGDLFENLQEEWVRPYRRRLRELAVKALEALLEEAAGQDARTLSLVEQLLAIDSCHQGAYQELMGIWARAGQPERVARLYWACQEALERELQLAPSAETTRLFQQLTESRNSQGSPQEASS